jgi:gluconolactonase
MKLFIQAFKDILYDIIDKDAELEVIADGFRFLEGPVWNPVERHLIFSDIQGNGIYRWSRRNGITLIKPNSHMANGNTLDREGRLLTCEHGSSRVIRTAKDGSTEVLASHYQGKQLNSPNDIIVKRDGGIYFTDPTPGRTERMGIPREQELPFTGVFRIEPDTGELTLLADDFSKPNGLCFSLDEKQLFVNDSDFNHIRIFDVDDDGMVRGGNEWAQMEPGEPGVADGMKFDRQGHLFCSGPGGLHVFDGRGTPLGIIHTPEVAANFTWGDDDMCSLYLTATSTLYRTRVRVPGLRLLQDHSLPTAGKHSSKHS